MSGDGYVKKRERERNKAKRMACTRTKLNRSFRTRHFVGSSATVLHLVKLELDAVSCKVETLERLRV